MRYSKEELAALIERELANALGGPQSEIAQTRIRNLQYYRAEAVGELSPPQIPDRSRIVATDVPDTVEWILPGLVRVFAQSPEAIEAKARTPANAQRAKLVSEYLRFLMWERNDGFMTLYQWFKDALIQKVGFVKVHWQEEPSDVEQTYSGLMPEQVAELLERGDLVPVAQESRTEKVAGQDVEVIDLTVKRQQVNGRCVIDVIPPEEMRIHSRARYSDEPLFIAQETWRTKADLEAEGYDLTGVSSSSPDWSMEEIERAAIQTPSWGDYSDGELTRYRVAECYIKLDQDKDGVPEWRRILMIGGTVMEDEKTDGHPFVWFCPNPVPHLLFGQCPADFAIEPQRLRTSLMRSLMDNVYMTVNKRTGVVDGQVNLDDLLNSRPGGVVRMKNPNALIPLEQGGLDSGAWQMVEWAEQWREQRTGFTRYSQGLSPDALNPTATGVDIITEKAEQRVELMARVAAAAVEKMLRLVLKCISRYQKVADVVELMGQWVPIDPRDWEEGFDVKVNVGLGSGRRDRKLQALQTVYQMQQPLIQAGAIPPPAVLAAGREFAEAAGLANADMLFPQPPPPDPNAPPPPPPPEIQIKQMELQADAQKFQAQTQADAQKFQAEAQLEQQRMQAQQQVDITRQQAEAEQQAYKAKLQADLQAQEAAMRAQLERERLDFERWKVEYQAAIDLQLAQVKATPATPTEPQVDVVESIRQIMADAVAQIRQPRKIVRGPDGRAQGIV